MNKGVAVATYGTSGSWTRILYKGSYRYISTQYVSKSKPSTSTKKLNVPYYNQYSLGYPSGCEFVSLKMALEYKKKAVSLCVALQSDAKEHEKCDIQEREVLLGRS
ncbi:hypothetical protein OVA29_10960 [Exiguobacterium sp. SL14]|nr:hypothetical protein [Exiguobacterium sp. SL14]MCY1691133.1 hypothetical protein [Exiguobacterium sp. SL14]